MTLACGSPVTDAERWRREAARDRRDRDQLRDGSCDAIADAEASIVDEDITVDGDGERNGASYELGDTLRDQDRTGDS